MISSHLMITSHSWTSWSFSLWELSGFQSKGLKQDKLWFGLCSLCFRSCNGGDLLIWADKASEIVSPPWMTAKSRRLKRILLFSEFITRLTSQVIMSFICSTIFLLTLATTRVNFHIPVAALAEVHICKMSECCSSNSSEIGQKVCKGLQKKYNRRTILVRLHSLDLSKTNQDGQHFKITFKSFTGLSQEVMLRTVYTGKFSRCH